MKIQFHRHFELIPPVLGPSLIQKWCAWRLSLSALWYRVLTTNSNGDGNVGLLVVGTEVNLEIYLGIGNRTLNPIITIATAAANSRVDN